jgi:hypothetical protein
MKEAKMMHRRVFFLVALFLMLVEASARSEEIPLMIPHTGTIAVGGTPFNGNGQFKFAIINGHADCNASPPGAGCAAYWSNDSTSTNGNEPTSGVTVSVNGGVFSIKLGDTALTNMQSIPINVFNHTTTYLRVWFNDGVTGFQQLSPDRQLVSVPYAFRAETANSVPGLGTSGTLNAEANPIDWTQLKNIPPGFADGVDQTGIASESDPTVLASVKDGISWSELSGVPAGFADGVDNTGGTSNDLVCSGCVDSTDIANGTILNDDINSAAAISPSKIFGDAGIDFLDIGSVSNIPTNVIVLGSIAINAPTSGFVFLFLQGFAVFFGEGTELIVGVSTLSTDFTLGAARTGRIDGTSTIRYEQNVIHLKVVSVSSGLNTFFAIAQKPSVFSAAQINLGDLKLGAIFIPKRY